MNRLDQPKQFTAVVADTGNFLGIRLFAADAIKLEEPIEERRA